MVNLDLYRGSSPHFYGNRRILSRHIANFVCGDAHHLPFRNHIFQKILCHHTLEHLDNPAIAIHEMARVANGVIEIVVPWYFCEKIHNYFMPKRREWAKRHHKHFFTKRQLETMLGEHGYVRFRFRLMEILRTFKRFRPPLWRSIFYGILGSFLPPLPELKAIIHFSPVA